jgi:hypothetical protein
MITKLHISITLYVSKCHTQPNKICLEFLEIKTVKILK